MFEKIYTDFYLKEDHSDVDKLLDEALLDFTLNKELNDILDKSILDERFIFESENLLEDLDFENSLLSKDVVLLEEGIKDIFKNIRKAPSDFTKVLKAKNMIEREYGLNLDKHISKYKNDLSDIAHLVQNKSNKLNDEKSVELLEKSITKKFLTFLPNLLKEISDDLAETLEYTAQELYGNFADNDTAYGRFIRSMLCAIIPTSINTIFNYLFKIIFSDNELAGKITATCVAPLTEEIAKLTAEKFVGRTKHGLSTYNIYFNILEFSDYFFKIFMQMSILLPSLKKSEIAKTAILARIPAIIMHTVNTGLIKIGMNVNSELGGETMTIVTIIIHAGFNGFWSFFKDSEKYSLGQRYLQKALERSNS